MTGLHTPLKTWGQRYPLYCQASQADRDVPVHVTGVNEALTTYLSPETRRLCLAAL